jgi:hypothetical protein
MTAQEAIKELNYDETAYGGKCTKPVREVAIEALEKQIPKKPLDVVTDDNEFICMICPSCEQIAVEFNDKYCSRCGQAIDWSVEND